MTSYNKCLFYFCCSCLVPQMPRESILISRYGVRTHLLGVSSILPSPLIHRHAWRPRQIWTRPKYWLSNIGESIIESTWIAWIRASVIKKITDNHWLTSAFYWPSLLKSMFVVIVQQSQFDLGERHMIHIWLNCCCFNCSLGREPPGTTREQVIYAKKLYESAFHPDTGDKQNVFGRMSFQVPGGMLITGAMLQFYRTVPAVVFWQWVNQSFNALVNYTNRNANSSLTVTQLGVSYASATSSALVAAIGCKSYWQKRASPFVQVCSPSGWLIYIAKCILNCVCRTQRYVPFAAVAAANFVNIPLMRQNELVEGVDVQDANGNVVGKSRVAAAKGISQVVFSRILMAAPGMMLLPVIMERLERVNWFRQMSVLHAPFQTLAVGGLWVVSCNQFNAAIPLYMLQKFVFSLMFMVPTACSIFPQKCSLDVATIKRFEPEFYEEMRKKNNDKLPLKVYFNKGL